MQRGGPSPAAAAAAARPRPCDGLNVEKVCPAHPRLAVPAQTKGTNGLKRGQRQEREWVWRAWRAQHPPHRESSSQQLAATSCTACAPLPAKPPATPISLQLATTPVPAPCPSWRGPPAVHSTAGPAPHRQPWAGRNLHPSPALRGRPHGGGKGEAVAHVRPHAVGTLPHAVMRLAVQVGLQLGGGRRGRIWCGQGPTGSQPPGSSRRCPAEWAAGLFPHFLAPHPSHSTPLFSTKSHLALSPPTRSPAPRFQSLRLPTAPPAAARTPAARRRRWDAPPPGAAGGRAGRCPTCSRTARSKGAGERLEVAKQVSA